MFKNPFSFKGRIRRSEYGISFIISFILQILFRISELEIEPLVILFLYIPVSWFMLAQGAKRAHDLDSSGWIQIIPFVVLWLIFGKGNVGKNDYGPDPKEISG
ncbi:MAG: DUF805 domain-containing protein [bacterium]